MTFMDRYQLVGYAILILSGVPASLITRSSISVTGSLLLVGLTVLVVAAFAPVVHRSRTRMVIGYTVIIGTAIISNLILYYCYFIYLPCARIR